MTYSEHMHIMEMEYAEADNSMIDIDFMLESAEASHRLDIADLDFKFEYCDDYDQDAKVQMYMTEAKTFGDKVKAAWNKFVEWLRGIVAKIFKLKPDDAKAKKAAAAHPKGIKVPFNLGETEKNMDKLGGFFNSASITKLTNDIDQLTKNGIKLNVNIKSGKLQTYQNTTALNAFLNAASGIVKAAVAPAGAVVGVGVLLKFMNKSFDFTKKLQAWAQDLANKADGKLNFIITPLQQIASTVSGINTSVSHLISGPDPLPTPEKVYKAESDVDIRGAAEALLKSADIAGGASSGSAGAPAKKSSSERYASNVSIFNQTVKNAGPVEGFNTGAFKSLCDKISTISNRDDRRKEKEKAQDMIDKLPDKTVKEDKAQESVDYNDGTVFSTFFESTDILGKSPDTTSTFLSTPDQNMNEIIALLDRF